MKELISDNVFKSVNSLEDLYELMPPEFSSFDDYKTQLEFFKEDITEGLSDFTIEELLKIWKNGAILKDVLFSRRNVLLFLTGIEFEKLIS